MVSPKIRETEGSTIKQPRQAMRQSRQGKEWHRTDAIGGYLLCMVGLFAACAVRVDLKTALWGFGLLHVGCVLIVLALWWRDNHRGTKAKLQPSRAIKKAQKAQGALLTKHAVSMRQ
jgi:hypothetical protein